MTTFYQRVIDPPTFVLHGQEVVEDVTIIVEPASPWRLLFTPDPAIFIDIGSDCLIRNCRIERAAEAVRLA